MKPIYLRVPPAPDTVDCDSATWEELWERFRNIVRHRPFTKPAFYHAVADGELWIWCRSQNEDRQIDYHVWCFTFGDDEYICDELFPMQGKPSRVWNRELRIWIDLDSFGTLHIGGIAKGDADVHLAGAKVMNGPELAEFEF